MSGETISNLRTESLASASQGAKNSSKQIELLSAQERDFFQYWRRERSRGWKSYNFYMIGFRYGLVFSCALILSIISGWYKRVPFFNYGDWLMISIALFLLTIFMSIFTAAYRREQNEQEYQRIAYKLGEKI